MACKLKDGLFMGDVDTAQDPEFLELNKISNLVNTAGGEADNMWANHGLAYLTFAWEDHEECPLFPTNDDAVKHLVDFIDGSIEYGISVLIYSVRGCGRSTVASCSYLMYKYGWGFEKCYDYIYARKPDIDVNRGFVQQMFALERRIQNMHRDNFTFPGDLAMRANSWDLRYLELCRGEMKEEEIVMVNSYINGKGTLLELPPPAIDAYDEPRSFVLKFNPLKQEEDIHMFPTEPQAPTAKAPLGSAMKGARAKRPKEIQATVTLASADAVKGAGMEGLDELSDVSDPPSIDLDGEAGPPGAAIGDDDDEEASPTPPTSTPKVDYDENKVARKPTPVHVRLSPAAISQRNELAELAEAKAELDRRMQQRTIKSAPVSESVVEPRREHKLDSEQDTHTHTEVVDAKWTDMDMGLGLDTPDTRNNQDPYAFDVPPSSLSSSRQGQRVAVGSDALLSDEDLFRERLQQSPPHIAPVDDLYQFVGMPSAHSTGRNRDRDVNGDAKWGSSTGIGAEEFHSSFHVPTVAEGKRNDDDDVEVLGYKRDPDRYHGHNSRIHSASQHKEVKYLPDVGDNWSLEELASLRVTPSFRPGSDADLSSSLLSASPNRTWEASRDKYSASVNSNEWAPTSSGHAYGSSSMGGSMPQQRGGPVRAVHIYDDDVDLLGTGTATNNNYSYGMRGNIMGNRMRTSGSGQDDIRNRVSTPATGTRRSQSGSNGGNSWEREGSRRSGAWTSSDSGSGSGRLNQGRDRGSGSSGKGSVRSLRAGSPASRTKRRDGSESVSSMASLLSADSRRSAYSTSSNKDSSRNRPGSATTSRSSRQVNTSSRPGSARDRPTSARDRDRMRTTRDRKEKETQPFRF